MRIVSAIRREDTLRRMASAALALLPDRLLTRSADHWSPSAAPINSRSDTEQLTRSEPDRRSSPVHFTPPPSGRGGLSGLSDPNITLGGALTSLVTRIEHSARFDQQQLDLVFSVRLVLDTLRNNEHLAS